MLDSRPGVGGDLRASFGGSCTHGSGPRQVPTDGTRGLGRIFRLQRRYVRLDEMTGLALALLADEVGQRADASGHLRCGRWPCGLPGMARSVT